MTKTKSYLLWSAFSFLSLTIIAFLTIKLPYWGDERHIVETIRLFSNNFNLATLKDYPEVTPPFFFIFYASWAKIFASSLESLRVLTLIISFTTWQLVFFLNSIFTKNNLHALILSLIFVLNPYVLGTSVFVFTDTFTIMLCITSIILFIKDKLLFSSILAMLAVLSRQYAIIVPLSMIVFLILQKNNKQRINWNYIFILGLSLIPLLILFLFWHGITPQSGSEKWIIKNSHFYNIDYINTYITFSTIYLLPLIIFFITKTKLNYRYILIALGINIVLNFFPVKPSTVTLVQTDYSTVGYIHKFILSILGRNNFVTSLILWICLLLGCYLNILIIKRFISNVKSQIIKIEVVPFLLWFFFLIIMPISYQVWEKYLTLVLPFLILSLYLYIFPISEEKLII